MKNIQESQAVPEHLITCSLSPKKARLRIKEILDQIEIYTFAQIELTLY